MSMRILLVVNSIGTGGAERVIQNLVSARASSPVPLEIHLALLDDLPLFRRIEPVDALHILDGRGSLARSAVQLRGLVGRIKPDSVVSFLIRANCANILATRGRHVRSILSERMNTGSHLELQFGKSWRARLARASVRALYPRCDRIIAVSQGVAANLVDEFSIRPTHIETIPNPFDLAAIRKAGQLHPSIELPDDFCVAVGRLVPAKNFAAVIDSFASARPTQTLVILGRGDDESRLRDVARSAGVESDVVFADFVDNPFAVVARARFLVSASRNEGFPNAAAEAMVLGIPVLLTDCPSGPRELLGGGEFGLLVPQDDPAQFDEAMRCLADPAVRRRFGHLAAARMEEFCIDRIAQRYWRLVCGTQSGPNDR